MPDERAGVAPAVPRAGTAVAANNFGPWPRAGSDHWRTQLNGFLCPSDSGAGQKQPNDHGRTNFVFSVGDTIPWEWVGVEENRGPFDYSGGDNENNGRVYPFHQVSDGLSKTLAMSERCVGLDSGSLKGGMVEHYNAVTGNPDTASPIACLSQVGSDGRYTSGSNTGRSHHISSSDKHLKQVVLVPAG
jgi:hypothetical protein